MSNIQSFLILFLKFCPQSPLSQWFIGLVVGCVFSTAISIICNYIWSQSRKILTPTKIISDPPQMIPDTFWVGPYLPLIIDSESNKLAIESRMKFDWLTWLFQINSTWTIFLFHLSITTWKLRVLATPPPTFKSSSWSLCAPEKRPLQYHICQTAAQTVKPLGYLKYWCLLTSVFRLNS